MAVVRDEHQINLRDLQAEALQLATASTVVAGFVLLLVALQVNTLANLGLLGIGLMFMTAGIGWLLQRFYLARVWALTVTWLLATYLLTLVFPSSHLVCLFALPVGLATLAIGAPAGLFVGAAASLMAGFSQGSTGSALVVIWSVFALFWLSARPLIAAMRWSWQSYAHALEQLEAARERQAELRQVVQDQAEMSVQMARLTDLLSAARHTAEEAERARADFTANVSHELRTPLNMILGFAEMIVEAPRTYGAKLPPALLADVAAIQRNSQHLASLINDVLDISQIEAQRMTLTREWNTLSDIIDGAATAVRPLFQSRRLSLDVHVPADLPRLYCDRTRIRQVLLNLLNNAGRFTEAGGVRIEAMVDGASVVVSVTDTGPGIAEVDMPKLFEPFRQLDGAGEKKQGGSGLGLNISRRFVELHGGRMGVESTLGKGSRFWFALPLSTPAVDMDMAARFLRAPYDVRRHSALTPKPQVTPRVIVLEAQDVLQSATRRYLDGVTVLGTADPDEARSLLAAEPAQMVMIRGESSEQTTAWIERMHDLAFATPVVAVSLPATQAAGGLHVAGYLTKPVTRQQLFQAIEDLGRPVRSVLLTDDDPEALQLFTRILSGGRRRCRVLQASNGPEALALMRARRPDLLLLDLVMPGMDGVAVLAEKNRDAGMRDIPVLILSAQDPSGRPIVAPSATITRSGGLSLVDLLRSALAVSETLGVSSPASDPVPQSAPAG